MDFGKDYYAILGLERTADEDTIRKKYKAMARQYHPDRAGSDPTAAEQFALVKEAYEVLSDPIQKALYDNPPKVQKGRRGVRIHRSSWRGSKGRAKAHKDPKRTASGRTRESWRKEENNVSLDELFSQMDPGFAESKQSAQNQSGRAASFRSSGSRSKSSPNQQTYQTDRAVDGTDVEVEIEVTSELASRGGQVEVEYTRLVRDDNMQLIPYNDLVVFYVTPASKDGERVRITKRGNMGIQGGPSGDLICIIRISSQGQSVQDAQNQNPRPRNSGQSGEEQLGNVPDGVSARLPISVVEALLGGRVEVDTPSGRVAIVVPPGSSSGRKLKLKGKGDNGGDWIVELMIHVPAKLDEESQQLIRRFAELNPEI
ncbi:MAG: hypothetical protein CMK59_15110 [Proteobacteria bacterium]|nr:hypothetical protein [Pseudomonadota bacterium]